MPIRGRHSDRRKRELQETTAPIEPPNLSGPPRTDDLPRPSAGRSARGYGATNPENDSPAAETHCARIGHNRGPPLPEIEPIAVRPRVAWRLLDCGNTHGYALLAAGELESYLDGRSRRITMRSIKGYIARRLASNRATAGTPIEPPRRRRGRLRKSLTSGARP
jgi:hypothetical protein